MKAALVLLLVMRATAALKAVGRATFERAMPASRRTRGLGSVSRAAMGSAVWALWASARTLADCARISGSESLRRLRSVVVSRLRHSPPPSPTSGDGCGEDGALLAVAEEGVSLRASWPSPQIA